MQQKLATPVELFYEFVRLRKNGANRDDAWYQIMKQAKHLTEQELQQMLAVAKDWERREGNQYRYRDEGQKQVADDTIIKPLRPLAQDQQPKTAAPPAPRERVTGELNPAALRDLERRQLEQLLDQAEKKSPVGRLDTQPIKAPDNSPINPTYFGPRTLLYLYFKGQLDPVKIRLEEKKEQMIGRSTPNSAMCPEIDLTPLEGDKFGVSRMHAAVMLDNERVLMTDVGSVNGTFINGQQIYQQEIRVLKDKDEVWFGQLACRVRFYHANLPGNFF